MRLGLVAWGTPTGLGYQTRALFRHLKPAKTMVIDLAARKGLPFYGEWFPGGRRVSGVPGDADCVEFLRDLDVVFCCETPLNYRLFEFARERGVRTVLQYNFEFLDYLARPNLPRPTVFAAPSPWMIERLAGWPVSFLPVPVEAEVFPQRKVTELRTVTHVAGRVAVHDRNGTGDFLRLAAACRDLDVEWVVFAQTLSDGLGVSGVRLVTETPSRAGLYAEGDVMVLPRRFGGLCLPLNEAMQSGLPVVMPAVDPQTRWLPPGWLVPARRAGSFRAKSEIDLWTTDSRALEAKIRAWAGDPGLVEEAASQARDIAAGMTWEALKPAYEAFLEAVMGMRP